MTMSTTWNAFPMLDRLFDDVMNGVAGTAFGTGAIQGAYAPAIDVRANDDEIVFVCDVPGTRQEDLEVTLEAGTLTIKGQRRYEGGDKDQVWLGRSYGAFERSFTLPDYVDADAMRADLSDGVLTIRVPKQAKAKPRRIAIGGGNDPTKQLGKGSEK
jgi:HSP20 family protein